MSAYKTKSEIILDRLAEGATMEEIKESGFDKKDIITAALFGIAELHEEYRELALKYNLLKDYAW